MLKPGSTSHWDNSKYWYTINPLSQPDKMVMCRTGCWITSTKSCLPSLGWGTRIKCSSPREPTPVRLSGAGGYPPCALAASRRVVSASWESSKEQKGLEPPLRTAQERGSSHLVPPPALSWGSYREASRSSQWVPGCSVPLDLQC